MKFIIWFFSPHAMLTGIYVSYFSLLLVGDFPSEVVVRDLFILGVLSVVLSYLIFARNFAFLTVTELLAGRVMSVICWLLLPVTIYLWSLFGLEFSALLNERFSIAGFGVISSLYFVCAFLGASILVRVKKVSLKIVFILLVFYSGYQIGGKGFVVPLLLGLSLSVSVGLHQVTPWKLLALTLAGIITVFLTFVDKGGSLKEVASILAVRVALAADSVNWISHLNIQDIWKFPITSFSFLADIVLRFVGVRLNPRSIGSELAFMVAGDDSGGGPNANLPVLAYLTNQGDLTFALIFILFIFTLAKIGAKVIKRRSLANTRRSIFYAAIAFLFPVIVIDLVVFLQYVFWIVVIASLESFLGWLAQTIRQGKSCEPLVVEGRDNGLAIGQPSAHARTI